MSDQPVSRPAPRSWLGTYLSDMGLVFLGIAIGLFIAGDWHQGLVALFLPGCAFVISLIEHRTNIRFF